MCLYTNQKTPAIADKSIICYKVVFRYNYIKGIKGFAAEYCDFVYHLHKIYIESRFPNISHHILDISRTVDYGFHSYCMLNTAIEYSKILRAVTVILKCEIPTGARYYTSVCNDEFCSEKIKVLAWKRYDEEYWHSTVKECHEPVL